MGTRHILLAASALLLTAQLAAPASATAHQCEPATDSYNCLIMIPNGLHHPGSATYCYATKAMRDPATGYPVFPLDQKYWNFIDTAADIWSYTPGIKVGLTGVAKCTSKTDIKVYGYHGESHDEGGRGGCAKDSSQHCAPGTGILFLSVDTPVNNDTANYLVKAAVHEFGHNLGLDHPCEKKCIGPIMSYGTILQCGDRCSNEPNYDDVVGLQVIYGWPEENSSGGSCLLTTTATSPGPIPRTWYPSIGDSGLLDEMPAGAVPATLPLPAFPGAGSATDAVEGAVDTVARLANPQVNAYDWLNAYGGTVSAELVDAMRVAGVGSFSPYVDHNPSKDAC